MLILSELPSFKRHFARLCRLYRRLFGDRFLDLASAFHKVCCIIAGQVIDSFEFSLVVQGLECSFNSFLIFRIDD